MEMGLVRKRDSFGSYQGMLDVLLPWQEQENSTFQLCAVPQTTIAHFHVLCPPAL